MHNITVINAKNGHTLKWVTQHNTVLYCYAIIRLFALAVYICIILLQLALYIDHHPI